MSEPSSEQERYTIDEMMSRLKTGGESKNPEGELVTRSDGTTAMKVRKRRRRTHQVADKETKRNQRIQILQIAGFVILVVLLGLAAGVGILYANSSSFRDGLISKLEAASGAKVSMKQFRMNPATADSNQVLLEWPSGNPLDSLFLRNVTAKIAPASFLGKTFGGEEITAIKGEMILKAPVDGGEIVSAKNKDSSGVVKFSRYSIPSLDIFFDANKLHANMLQDSEVSLFPSTVAGRGELRMTGGVLKKQNWPPMELDRAYIKIKNTNLEVKSMRFIIPRAKDERNIDRGFLEFSGTVQPLDAGATHILVAEMESFRLSYLLGADLGRFFLGKVESKDSLDANFLAIQPNSDEPDILKLELGNALDSRIDLSGFVFLSELALALGERWYDLPNFDDEISLEVTRQGEKVEMKNINLVERGRMALRGEIANGEGGAISGTLRVGLPDAIVVTSRNKRIEQMFGQVREGFRWIELEIGGTSAAPADNFRELYNAARFEIQNQPQEEAAPPDSFEDLIDSE